MKRAIFGDLLDFAAAPPWRSTATDHVRWRPGHWLLVGDDGRIVDVVRDAPGGDWQRIDHAGCLVMPGFVDSHVHCPQLDVIASHGDGLLDWLESYTFPAEGRYADPAAAAAGSALFLDALLAHGTTAAVVYPTVHAAATDALFAAASERGMRIVAGKVLMDRHAPDGLRDDDLGQAERDCEALIARWHGRARCAYAVTVRFAATSTPAQLAMAGRLLARHDGVYLQTHVAENRDEVAWIARLFPAARSYLDVYAAHGLLTERAVLAHGIWLDAADRALLHDAGAQIAYCPSSNLFLGSGLYDWQAAVDAGHATTIGSDVGGGTSLSIPKTLADGYKVQMLRGTRLSAWTLLHAATRGAADALHLGDEIGSFDRGCTADAVAWSWAHGPVATHRDAVARGLVAGLAEQSLHARVFAWLTLADERNVVATYVGGELRSFPLGAPARSARGAT